MIEVFRQRPALAAELLTDQFTFPIPKHEASRLDSGDLTALVPTEFRADAVVVLSMKDQPALAVIVEVQLGQNKNKRWSWPAYLAILRARLHCPTVLLVVCPTTTNASLKPSQNEVPDAG